MNVKTLIKEAMRVRENAYAPYSHMTVGAALLTAGDKVYCGCNMENAAYSPTLCAERSAFSSAIARGERDFSAIVIVGGEEGKESETFFYPCGVCRQVIREFCDNDFKIVVAKNEFDYEVYSLKELLPHAFGL